MSDSDRDNLAEMQAKLMAALTACEGSPAGFDEERIRLTARTLLVKRRQAITKTWPVLLDVLGDELKAMFAEYAQLRPMPAAGHVADGRAFAEHLLLTHRLPDAGCIVLLLARARTGWPVRWLRLRQKRRWAVAVRIRGRVRWIGLPW